MFKTVVFTTRRCAERGIAMASRPFVCLSVIIIGTVVTEEHMPPSKNRERYFSGNYCVKFGHFSGKNYVKFRNFVNFSGI